MVTAEGTFPKTGNDPIYASEINNFMRCLGSITNLGSRVTTGTDVIGGSVVIPANTVRNIFTVSQIRFYGQNVSAGDVAKTFTVSMNGSSIGTCDLTGYSNSTFSAYGNGVLIGTFSSGAMTGPAVIQVNISSDSFSTGYTEKTLLFGY